MADTLTAEGKLLGANAVEQITDKFKKRKFWVETDLDSQWPQVIEFELVQDKVDVIDKYKVGDMVRVGFNLRGRKYTSKKTGQEGVINSLNAWFVDKSKSGNTAPAAPVTNDASDDLPF